MKIRSVGKLVLLALPLIAFCICLKIEKAQAKWRAPNCSRQIYGRCLNLGYATGSEIDDNGIFLPADFKYTDQAGLNTPFNDWALPNVAHNSTYDSAYTEQFIALYNDYLNRDITGSPNCQAVPTACLNLHYVVGAAITINAMTGKDGSDFGDLTYIANDANWFQNQYKPFIAPVIASAKARFNNWAARLRQLNAAGLINWNEEYLTIPGDLNSESINAHTDNDFYEWPITDLVRAITIHDESGTVVYRIERQCANLIPVANTIGNPLLQPVLTPVYSTSVNDDENPTTVTFDLSISVDVAPFKNISVRRDYYKIVGGIKSGIGVGSETQNGVDFNNTSSVNFPTRNFGVVGLNAGDSVCQEIRLNPYTANADTNGNIVNGAVAKTFNPSCKVMYNKPYVRTFGGDSFAGTTCGAGTGWPATHETSGNIDAGGIYGQGNDTGVTGRGSASQLAMLSLYEIRNFRSSIVKGGAQDRLLFGNTNLPAFSVSSGPKGGYFGTAHCPLDYLADMPGADKAVNLGTDGTYKQTGPYTLPAANNFNNRVVIFIDGDVKITNDFKYNTAGWTDRSNIPSLTLIATGNIYIGENVTQLDGTYVAQGEGVNPPPQTIYTCAKTGAVPAGYLSTDANYFDICNNQLTINGSFIAARIKFLRTFGSLRNSSGANDHPNNVGGGPGTSNSCANAGLVSSPGTCAAEVINFRPEAYMTLPPSNNSKLNFDLVTTPPPLL